MEPTTLTVEQAVRLFHETYNVPFREKPGFPSQERRDLRWKLLQEELEELAEANADGNIIEFADALADIVYIVVGTAIEHGIPFDKIFAEVQASNMSKLGEDGKPIIREDGKVLKGPNYFQPRIAQIILEAMANNGTEIV